MTGPAPVVFVVDDDPSVGKALARLFRSAGLGVEVYTSAREFLGRETQDVPGCLVLDLKMPGIGGLDLQRDLKAAGVEIPIVFLTGHADVPASVKAMKAGAVDFLEKPFEGARLLEVVRAAVEKDLRAREERAEVAAVRRRVESLTPREREVFDPFFKGMLNKQVAHALGNAEKTVKVHRARVMRKMGADSLAELVRLALKAGVAT